MRRVLPLLYFLCSAAYAQDPGTRLHIESEDGRFSLNPGAHLQVRAQFQSANSDEPQHAFSIPRGRLLVAGHAWSKDLSYFLLTNWSPEQASLVDAFINYRIGAGVQVRVGQYKKPFSRHFLQDNPHVALVDYATIGSHYGTGRDVGLMFHNGIAQKTGFEWSIGTFDGGLHAPDDTGLPRRIHPIVVGRIGLSTPGMEEYSQIDFEGGSLRVAVGLNTQLDFDSDRNNDGNSQHGLDGMVKIGGLGGQFAIYTQTLQSDPDRWTAQQVVDYGLHTEANFVVDKRLAPAIRYSLVHARDRANGTDLEELTAGFTTYFQQHAVKWAHDIGALTQTDLGRRPRVESMLQIRTQVELSF